MRLEPSVGGLATGLSGLHSGSDSVWIGWPGEIGPLDLQSANDLEERFAERRLRAVSLTREEVRRYYEGYSNGVLWPLFHYMLDRLPLRVPDWDAYESVNARFADEVAAEYRPGDRIWVHDYQLMLLPRMLRERIPSARIGFFLHIPFPASEVFRTLPQRAELLRGLLGADLIGFHTASYLRHFCTSVLRILGAPSDVEHVTWEGRDVRLGAFPMSIDAQDHAARADAPETRALVRDFRQNDEQRLLVGIDRLDYSKGLPRRFLAFEKLLQDHPELHGKVRLIQVCVPSRTEVDAYREFRQEIDSIIGRIQGAFATPNWVPIHYLYRGLSPTEISALYRAADVVLVTPLRDGMNLVAKEFVASRTDGDGVLILSEFAGAAAELAEAVHVNPYDIDATADAIHASLAMPEDERRTRMAGLRARVLSYDVLHWVRAFLQRLEEPAARLSQPATSTEIDEAVGRMRRAHRLILLLDYDGTIRPFAKTPELALPDTDLLALLRGLAGRARTEVHLLSGRTRKQLDRWFSGIPIGLHAEHGLFSRRPGRPDWESLVGPAPDTEWMDSVVRILHDFADRTPGSGVERKTASLAWHWRSADPEFGAMQANELRLHLSETLSNMPVAVLTGDHVVEVRPHALHKGCALAAIDGISDPGAVVVAAGDDRPDEDLFAALPEGALTIKVGATPTRAKLIVRDPRSMRALLRELL